MKTEEACTAVKLPTLDDRRVQISLSFGIKCLRHPHHKTLFPKAIDTAHWAKFRNQCTGDHNRYPTVFQQPFCKTTRYENSPVP